jgi:sortase A
MTLADRGVLSHRRAERPKTFADAIGVFGELLVTVAVIALLFLVWRLWFNDIVVLEKLSTAGTEITTQWETSTPPLPAADPPEPVNPPYVLEQPNLGETFGVLLVPRWGADYAVPITEGTTTGILEKGAGRYTSTQMPGELGNFAVAGHRTTFGAPFRKVEELRRGDSIYIETEAGWHQYLYRDREIVAPTAIRVLEPVPNEPGVEPVNRVITLTTCHPIFSSEERMIVYGLYEGWYPREGGAPAELAGLR